SEPLGNTKASFTLISSVTSKSTRFPTDSFPEDNSRPSTSGTFVPSGRQNPQAAIGFTLPASCATLPVAGFACALEAGPVTSCHQPAIAFSGRKLVHTNIPDTITAK